MAFSLVMYWDAHCHLSDLQNSLDLGPFFQEAKERQITGFVLGGYDPLDWERQWDLKTRYSESCITPVFGLHPMWVSQASDTDLEAGLDKLARWLPRSPLIGEIGLDGRPLYQEGWSKQMDLFRAQLELARFTQKPIVLHVVRSHDEALRFLQWHQEMLYGGFVHGYSGSFHEAEQYIRLGFSLSIGRRMTQNHATGLREIVRRIPMEHLLIETDSPDLHRPAVLWNSIWEIAEVVGALKSMTADEVLQKSTQNIQRILGI